MLDFKLLVKQLHKKLDAYKSADPDSMPDKQKDLEQIFVEAEGLIDKFEQKVTNALDKSRFEKWDVGLTILPTLIALVMVVYVIFYHKPIPQRKDEDVQIINLQGKIIEAYDSATLRADSFSYLSKNSTDRFFFFKRQVDSLKGILVRKAINDTIP